MSRKSRAKPPSPFLRFNSSPEVIRLVVLMYVRFPLSLRNVEDLLFDRGIDICHETVRLWWNRFGSTVRPHCPIRLRIPTIAISHSNMMAISIPR